MAEESRGVRQITMNSTQHSLPKAENPVHVIYWHINHWRYTGDPPHVVYTRLFRAVLDHPDAQIDGIDFNFNSDTNITGELDHHVD